MNDYNVPLDYTQLNVLDSYLNPTAFESADPGLTRIFRRYLVQRAMSSVKWKLPKHWNANYFLYSLVCGGTVAVFNTDKFGWIPNGCSLGGINVMYQPTHALVANPLLQNLRPLQIDRDCVLFKLQPDYRGIMDLVQIFAELAAIIASSCGSNIVACRLAYAFAASNESTAQSWKKAADKAMSGVPFVVIDKNLYDKNDGTLSTEFFTQNVGANFIAPDLLNMLESVFNKFDTFIGIPSANQTKKERMIVDEANANQAEAFTLPDMWLDDWQESCRKLAAMAGEDLVSVDWRIKPQVNEGGADNADRHDHSVDI